MMKRKSRYGLLVIESRGWWNPGTRDMPKFASELQAEVFLLMVGYAGILRRY